MGQTKNKAIEIEDRIRELEVRLYQKALKLEEEMIKRSEKIWNKILNSNYPGKVIRFKRYRGNTGLR